MVWVKNYFTKTYTSSRISKIKPDSIQVDALDHKGIISNLRGATREELQRVVNFWKLDNVEIISALLDRKNKQSYRYYIETAIFETTS